MPLYGHLFYSKKQNKTETRAKSSELAVSHLSVTLKKGPPPSTVETSYRSVLHTARFSLELEPCLLPGNSTGGWSKGNRMGESVRILRGWTRQPSSDPSTEQEAGSKAQSYTTTRVTGNKSVHVHVHYEKRPPNSDRAQGCR